MSDPQTVEGYRLVQVEKAVESLGEKIDRLPEVLDKRYALKTDVQPLLDAAGDRKQDNSKMRDRIITGAIGVVFALITGGAIALINAFATILNAANR